MDYHHIRLEFHAYVEALGSGNWRISCPAISFYAGTGALTTNLRLLAERFAHVQEGAGVADITLSMHNARNLASGREEESPEP